MKNIRIYDYYSYLIVKLTLIFLDIENLENCKILIYSITYLMFCIFEEIPCTENDITNQSAVIKNGFEN